MTLCPASPTIHSQDQYGEAEQPHTRDTHTPQHPLWTAPQNRLRSPSTPHPVPTDAQAFKLWFHLQPLAPGPTFQNENLLGPTKSVVMTGILGLDASLLRGGASSLGMSQYFYCFSVKSWKMKPVLRKNLCCFEVCSMTHFCCVLCCC